MAHNGCWSLKLEAGVLGSRVRPSSSSKQSEESRGMICAACGARQCAENGGKFGAGQNARLGTGLPMLLRWVELCKTGE